MELVNEIYPAPRRRSRPRGGSRSPPRPRCVFPFAPHLGAEVYELMTGEPRVGAAMAGRRPGDAARPTRSSSSARSTARSATGSRRPTGAPREELEQLALDARGVQAHLNGHQVVKVIVVPDKLVNIVVRA